MAERIDLALQVLARVAAGAVDAEDIARDLVMPGSDIRRVLAALEASGTIRRGADGSLDISGSVAASLTGIAAMQTTVAAAIRGLRAMVTDVDAVRSVWVRDGNLVRRVVDIEPPTHEPRALLGVPATAMHEAAAGIALLAAASDDDVERYLGLLDDAEDVEPYRALVGRARVASWAHLPGDADRTDEVAVAVTQSGTGRPMVALAGRLRRPASARDDREVGALGDRLRATAAAIAQE